MEVRLSIFSEPCSKANSRRLVLIAGKPRFIKSRDALEYERAVALQVHPVYPLLEGPLGIECRIFYASHRKDLDPSLIFDGLQGRIFKNDRQLREMHLYHAIDRENPRAEVRIWELAPNHKKTGPDGDRENL